MNKTLTFIKKNLFDVLSILAIISFIIFYLFFSLIRVSGVSMKPTYNDQDLSVILKTNNVKNGDIITIDGEALAEYSGNEVRVEGMIKRVIGEPGDKVSIIDEVIYVNDEALDESYIDAPMVMDLDLEIDLKENEFFVLGDNRNNSLDSRLYGPVPKEAIKGKVILDLHKSSIVAK